MAKMIFVVLFHDIGFSGFDGKSEWGEYDIGGVFENLADAREFIQNECCGCGLFRDSRPTAIIEGWELGNPSGCHARYFTSSEHNEIDMMDIISGHNGMPVSYED